MPRGRGIDVVEKRTRRGYFARGDLRQSALDVGSDLRGEPLVVFGAGEAARVEMLAQTHDGVGLCLAQVRTTLQNRGRRGIVQHDCLDERPSLARRSALASLSYGAEH